ncbi:hypothetical protein [Kibdelosporangium phytohabitans]|uniref:Uncharacterized protein n=1 Tax=Kibdelosporangium phytohabitans TaxID=860235 RepID=A0A0N7F351_9PSEU|nr:hypothetical protein [Kibdelosporangium phytohabitans]ALG07655.1 hypothetical protein AOZ06_12720 [Kibdelosporangium phytohabitans]ALG07711.1 hypothetical protein AOZ06_13040 [Kibdelosporangium phytohabitans]MBE1471388.1 hypothetical protein [Kibdelosporangium phytohabitans]
MTAPKTPTLAELGKILGDLVPTLQWVEGVQNVTAKAVEQETNAVLGKQTLNEAQARAVAWRVLSDLGTFVRDVEPGTPEPGADAAPETFDD